jgi:hypothetical protein
MPRSGEKVLYNILTEYGLLMKLVRLIKMCLSEVYNKVRIGRKMFEAFPIQNGLKEGDASTQWVLGSLSPGVNLPGREVGHSPPSDAVVRDAWNYTSTPR